MPESERDLPGERRIALGNLVEPVEDEDDPPARANLLEEGLETIERVLLTPGPFVPFVQLLLPADPRRQPFQTELQELVPCAPAVSRLEPVRQDMHLPRRLVEEVAHHLRHDERLPDTCLARDPDDAARGFLDELPKCLDFGRSPHEAVGVLPDLRVELSHRQAPGRFSRLTLFRQEEPQKCGKRPLLTDRMGRAC